MFNSYLVLVGVCRELKEWDAAVKYCKLVIEGLKFVSLDNQPELGDAYWALGEALLGQAASADGSSEEHKDKKAALLTEALEVYQKCLQIRLICRGKKHSTTKEAQQRVNELTPAKPSQNSGNSSGKAGKKKKNKK